MDLGALGIVAFATIAAVVAVDSVAPVVPSEVLVVSAAVGAPSLPSIAGVAVAAALGALVGDAFMYWVGRRVAGRPSAARLRQRSARHDQLVAGVESMAARMSTPLIIGGRFVPLGRTTVALAAGATGVSLRTYAPAAAVGAMSWGVVTTGLGRVGASLTDHLVLRMGLGLAAGMTIGMVAMAVSKLHGPRPIRRG